MLSTKTVDNYSNKLLPGSGAKKSEYVVPLSDAQKRIMGRIDRKVNTLLLKKGCSESALMIELWDSIPIAHALINDISLSDLQLLQDDYSGLELFLKTLKRING